MRKGKWAKERRTPKPQRTSRAERLKECPSGKAPFKTEIDAVLYGSKVGLHPYECPHCAAWHLTKQRR